MKGGVAFLDVYARQVFMKLAERRVKRVRVINAAVYLLQLSQYSPLFFYVPVIFLLLSNLSRIFHSIVYSLK